MIFLYRFFDYKYNISGFTSDLFSTEHIIYVILAVIAAILLGIFLRNVSHKKLAIFLKVLAITTLALEITKISWESYYDITTGRGFNRGGIIPLYTCSLFIYTLLLSSFGKGKVREYSLSFLSTICMVSGLIGVIYCNGLNYYPFWTFGAFYSLFFHASMLITGVIILSTGYYKLNWSDIYKAWIPMVFLAFIAIPVNYEYGADYMQIHEGSGVPLMSDLAKIMAAHNIRFIFVFLMLSSYLIISTIVVAVYKLVLYLINKNSHNLKHQETFA